jgi:hypothetical protein
MVSDGLPEKELMKLLYLLAQIERMPNDILAACSSSCRSLLTRSASTCSSGYRAINVASRSGRGCTSLKASSKVAAGLCSSPDMLVVVSLS